MLLLVSLSINVYATTQAIDLGDYQLTYTYDETDTIPGDTFSLTVTIINTDSVERTDIDLDLTDSHPFVLVGDSDLEIDSLMPGQQRSKTFKIEVAYGIKEDDYDLSFDLKDDDDDYDGIFDIEVNSIVPEVIVGSVSSMPTTLTPDIEDVQLMLTLQNIGEGDANYLIVELELPNGFKSSNSYSDITNLGILAKDQSKTATFFIDIEDSVKQGNHQGKLKLSYEDEDNNKKIETIDFNLPLKGKPLFKVVNAITDPFVINPGDEGVQLKINIKNMGVEDGKETSIRVFENSDIPISFDEKTDFIGNIKPYQKGTAVFSFDVEDDASIKEYIVKIQIRTINNGDVIVKEESILIPIVAEKKSDFSTTMLLGGVLLLAFVILIILFLLFILKKK